MSLVLTWDDDSLSGCPQPSVRIASFSNQTSPPCPDHIHRENLDLDSVTQAFMEGRQETPCVVSCNLDCNPDFITKYLCGLRQVT